MAKKLKIGITGGIGSGKSVVTGFLKESGYPVIKSDEIAKELMLKDEKVKKKLVAAFGVEVFENNVLNTKYLAEKIFNSKENVVKINSIVHPAVIKKNDELAKQLFNEYRIVFVESALIYEAKIQDKFDFIILVYSDETDRIKRTVLREKTTVEEIKKRMAFQIPDEKKKNLAHFVIENNSTIDDLKSRTLFILNLLKSITI